MLCDLTRQNWLEALQLAPEQAPEIVWLRGTRNLAAQVAEHRPAFEELASFTVPNGLFDDLLIGRMAGARVLFASVYGAAMASDLVQLGGALGARLVLLTGCCGSLRAEFEVGDLLVATQCGDLKARMFGRDMGTLGAPGRLHFGSVHSTLGIMSDRREVIQGWAESGTWGVDLETATVYAAAERFDIDRVALLYAYDHPLGEQHHLHHDDPDLKHKRAQGNAYMNGLARAILSDYLRAKSTASSERSSESEPLANRSTSA